MRYSAEPARKFKGSPHFRGVIQEAAPFTAVTLQSMAKTRHNGTIVLLPFCDSPSRTFVASSQQSSAAGKPSPLPSSSIRIACNSIQHRAPGGSGVPSSLTLPHQDADTSGISAPFVAYNSRRYGRRFEDSPKAGVRCSSRYYRTGLSRAQTGRAGLSCCDWHTSSKCRAHSAFKRRNIASASESNCAARRIAILSRLLSNLLAFLIAGLQAQFVAYQPFSAWSNSFVIS
jgi:hypothetical protein